MPDPNKKLPKENKETGFKYKKLEYHSSPKMELLPEDGDVKAVIEEEPVATMYGYPAQMQSKATPLHKKGKMSPCYKEDPKWFEFKKKKQAKQAAEEEKDARTAAIEAQQEGLDPAITTTTPNVKIKGRKKKIKTRHTPDAKF